jgi:hypothetical protein
MARSSWSTAKTLTEIRREARTWLSRVDCLPSDTTTIGGSSESEVKALTVVA